MCIFLGDAVLAGPDLCRGPGVQLVPFRSLLPGNDEFLPLSPCITRALAQPIPPGKPALLPAASSRSTDPGFSVAHLSTYVTGGGIIAERWGWRQRRALCTYLGELVVQGLRTSAWVVAQGSYV